MTILTATELSTLVTELLPVATLADLRELAAPDHQASISVQGGAAAGDGDGGDYWWDSDDSTADDGDLYIKPDATTGAGRWRRIQQDSVVEPLSITNAHVATAAAIESSKLQFTPSGSGAVARTVQAKLRGMEVSAEDFPTIQAALDTGAPIVHLEAANYNLGASLTFLAGQKLIGKGKAYTTITLTADIIPFDIANLSDTGARDFLVVAYATQSVPIVRLTASTVTVARNDFDDIQVSASALTFTPIQLRATGAFGVWNNNFHRWSISGVGTVVELNTSAADGWVRTNRFENFYVNDYVIGVDFVRSAGDGSNENVFKNWGAQSSARTTHGFRIPSSPTLKNAKNLFDGFSVYDLQGSGVYYNIGAGVEDTEIRHPTAIDYPTSARFVDNGVRTKDRSQPNESAILGGFGRAIQIASVAGWTEAVTGSGSTALQAAYVLTRTGTTLDSTARRYTEPIGLSAGSIFAVNYDKPMVIRFGVGRATSEANAVGRVQLKNTQAEGAMAAKGLGIRVSNYALYGESYGSAGAFVDLSTTLADTAQAWVEIRFYPADRVEWWVNGVYKAQQSTAANLPNATTTAYLVQSLVTSVSDPSGDAQMFVTPISIWVDQ